MTDACDECGGPLDFDTRRHEYVCRTCFAVFPSYLVPETPEGKFTILGGRNTFSARDAHGGPVAKELPSRLWKAAMKTKTGKERWEDTVFREVGLLADEKQLSEEIQEEARWILLRQGMRQGVSARVRAICAVRAACTVRGGRVPTFERAWDGGDGRIDAKELRQRRRLEREMLRMYPNYRPPTPTPQEEVRRFERKLRRILRRREHR